MLTNREGAAWQSLVFVWWPNGLLTLSGSGPSAAVVITQRWQSSLRRKWKAKKPYSWLTVHLSHLFGDQASKIRLRESIRLPAAEAIFGFRFYCLNLEAFWKPQQVTQLPQSPGNVDEAGEPAEPSVGRATLRAVGSSRRSCTRSARMWAS